MRERIRSVFDPEIVVRFFAIMTGCRKGGWHEQQIKVMCSDAVLRCMFPGFYNRHDSERRHQYRVFLNKRMPGYIFAYGAQVAACWIWRSLGRCRSVRAEQCVLPLFFTSIVNDHDMEQMHREVGRGVSSSFE